MIIIILPHYPKKTVKIFGNLKLKLNICDVKLSYTPGNKSCLFCTKLNRTNLKNNIMNKKITLTNVLTEGFSIGIKNFVSLFVATLLWIVTIWIPFINVGTTIAIKSVPIELSKGKIISPLFIFDKKYRQYMGEFFNLIGLMMLSLIPAFLFMIVPGIIISIGWSLAIYIMLDKEVSPSDALIMSNKATYGYKWIIFGVSVVLGVCFFIVNLILGLIPLGFLSTIISLLLMCVYQVVNIGCEAVIYRDLTKEESDSTETNVDC